MGQNDLPPATDDPEWVVRTLLFVDVVESVRLMEENETDAVRRWRQLIGVVEKDILALHQGRLVKSQGDGLFLECSAVPSAVNTAFAVQGPFPSINSGVPSGPHILLRAGAHVGHRIADDRDVYGSGV